MNEPYFVEVDANGCRKCSAGRTWTVAGPEGVAISTSWGGEDGEETAQKVADWMNEAYATGAAEVEKAEKELLLGLLAELVDQNECSYDHHGYCQEHGLNEKPCPHERAKKILEAGR